MNYQDLGVGCEREQKKKNKINRGNIHLRKADKCIDWKVEIKNVI